MDLGEHGSCLVPLLDGTTSSIVLSRVGLGQGFTSGSIVGSSDNGPIPWCMAGMAPTRSLEWLLPGHWMVSELTGLPLSMPEKELFKVPQSRLRSTDPALQA